MSGTTAGGVVVTEETAMTYATVWACVNKLSKTIATLPLHVKEHTGPRSTRNASEQKLDSLLRLKPNPEQIAVQFREAVMANLLLWGNAYVLINEDVGGVKALWLLLSRYMTVDRRQDGELAYDYREPGKPLAKYRADQILHIAGLGFDGLLGLSVIGYHRQTVGVGLGATTHVNSFLEHGAQTGMVIERPVEAGDLSPEGEANILDSFDTRHGGSTNAWRTALLREGMTLKTVGMPLKDMEFVSLRRFQKGDIAAIFDVPLTKIHENERDIQSNVENKNIDWSTDSLLPWCVKLENAFDAKFFEGTDFFLKHNLAGIVRGDLMARYEAYAIGRQWGWLSVDDVRESEDMNPIEGEGGDTYLSPMNMVPADQVGEVPERTPREPVAPAKAADLHSSFRRLALEAAQRCVTKEVKAVGNAWKKHAKAGTVEDFTEWAEKFYFGHKDFVAMNEKGHSGYMLQTMRPVVQEWAAAVSCENAEAVLLAACDIRETWHFLKTDALAAPDTVPRFLTDLSETAPALLVADIEKRLTEGMQSCTPQPT